jgi:site-specific recombinase XerD
VVEKLKKAAQMNGNTALRCRKELMIASFEQTGARVGEIDLITVKDVEVASCDKGSAPMLRVTTLKKRDRDHTRLIPVPRVFIQQAMKYIQRYRRRIIRKTIGSANDHGYLFVCHVKGTKLASGTLANEISDLCRVAKITDQPAHWHLFRHAFITQKLKAIILQHDIANHDEFRKALLNTEAFKQQLQQWTGHDSLSALDVYINLAFSELSNMDMAYNAVNLGSAVSVFQDRLDSLKEEIVKGESPITYLVCELEELIGTFQEDLDLAAKY